MAWPVRLPARLQRQSGELDKPVTPDLTHAALDSTLSRGVNICLEWCLEKISIECHVHVFVEYLPREVNMVLDLSQNFVVLICVSL